MRNAQFEATHENAKASWTAAVRCRFGWGPKNKPRRAVRGASRLESGRGLPQSKTWRRVAAVVLVVSPLLVGAAEYTLDWHVVPSGGGASGDVRYLLRDTAGQPAVGVSSVGTYQLEDGFWAGMNTAPLPVPDTLIRSTNCTAKIRLATVLANDTDPDGDAFSLSSLDSVSAQGGSVTLLEGWICYVPPLSYNDADTFHYVLTDAEGNRATNTVTIQMAGADDGQTRNIIAIVSLPNSHKLVSFVGIATRAYTIQWKADLSDPQWQTLATRVADAHGLFECEDTTEPVPSQRFYRAVSY
jgi:hypothetical protein